MSGEVIKTAKRLFEILEYFDEQQRPLSLKEVALRFGCNDFGSLMIEENVVSSANTTHRTSIEEMERLIRDAGFTPARRRQDYSIIAPAAGVAA